MPKRSRPRPCLLGAAALAVLLVCGPVSLGSLRGPASDSSDPNTQPPGLCEMPPGTVARPDSRAVTCPWRGLPPPLRADGSFPAPALCCSPSRAPISPKLPGKVCVSRMKGPAAVPPPDGRRPCPAGRRSHRESRAHREARWSADPGSLCPACRPWGGPSSMVGRHVEAPAFQPGRPGGSQEAASAARVYWGSSWPDASVRLWSCCVGEGEVTGGSL